MMKRHIVVAAILCSVVVACGSDDDSTTDTSAAPAATAAATEASETTTSDTATSDTSEPGTTAASSDSTGGPVEFAGQIKFGFIAERAGNYQTIGVPNFNSSTMAIEKINEAGGIEIDGEHYEVVLEVRDSRTEEAQASAAAIELTEEESVKFMFGGIGIMSPLVLDVTEQAGAIYFSSSSSAAARLADSEYLFVTVPETRKRVESTLKGIRHFFPDAKRLAGMYPQEATTEAIRPLLAELAPQYGFELVAEEVFAAGAGDLTSNLTNIAGADPDVLFIGFSVENSAAVVQANAEVDAAPVIFSYATSCINGIEAGVDRPLMAYTLVAADVDNPSTPVAIQFKKDYIDHTGESDPENVYTALWNYDFFFILADAIERAGTFEDVDAVKAALLETDYEGVSGKIMFDEKRQALTGAEICMYPGEGDQEAIESTYIAP